MDEAVIGVDIGSSRVKAVAYDHHGTALREAAATTPVRRRGALQDFPVLDVVVAARGVLAEAAAGVRVAGVGVTSMGEVGTIATRGDLVPMSFPSWHDARGAEVVERLSGLARSLGAHAATGGHFRTVSTVAKLAWLAEHHGLPSGTFVNVASALAWTLTGQCMHDASLSVTTGVVNPLDGSVLDELWAAAGLGSVVLPPVAEAGSAAPTIADRARTLGLAGAIPVVVAGHDHPVAAVGTGAPRGAVVDSLGTGEPLIAPFANRAAGSGAPRQHWPPEGFSIEASPSTGEPIAIAEGLRPGLAMDALVSASGLRRSDLDARIETDAEDTLDPEDVIALEEGIVRFPADEHAWSALHAHVVARAAASDRAVRELTGAAGPSVLTGGGLRSRAWVAMKARSAHKPLVVSTATETAARGAAAIAGVAAHWWDAPESMPGAELVAVDEWLQQSDPSD